MPEVHKGYPLNRYTFNLEVDVYAEDERDAWYLVDQAIEAVRDIQMIANVVEDEDA